jgi:nitroreductase
MQDLGRSPLGGALLSALQSSAVPRDVVRSLLESATHAPSNFNRQPWQFLVADTPEVRSSLATLLRQRRTRFANHPATDHDRCSPPCLEQGPVVILCFYKPSPERIEQVIAATLGSGDINLFNPNLVSTGMAVLNLLVAAHEHGLGGCVHFDAVPFLAEEVNRRLRLPPNLHLAGVLTLGHPAEAREPSTGGALQELIRTRRSVRLYQPQEVPRPLVEDLLRLASATPRPSLPAPPWRFLVYAPARCAQIADLLNERLASLERLDLDVETAYVVHPFLDHQRRWNYPLEHGRALVLCFSHAVPTLQETAIAGALGTTDALLRSSGLFSLGLGAQALLLGAHAHGLGACMQSGPVPFLRGRINAMLDVPDDLQLAGVVSLGYPAEEPEPKNRKPVEKVARFLSSGFEGT